MTTENEKQTALAAPESSFQLSRPGSYDEAVKYAQLIAASDMVPKDYRGKPGNVLVAAEMGANLGLKPMQAIQNIAVINGRPAIWGDLLIAVVMSHKDFAGHSEDWDPETKTATATFLRKGPDGEVMRFTESFSWAEAVQAGLAKKDLYVKYPKRMLGWRAKGYAARMAFADALKGIGLREELIYTEAPRQQPTAVHPMTDAPTKSEQFAAMLEDKSDDEPVMTIDRELIDNAIAEAEQDAVDHEAELEEHFRNTIEAES